jgi:hypothetical protein
MTISEQKLIYFKTKIHFLREHSVVALERPVI